MNLMSQGSAIHNMHDSHLQEEIKDRLDQIDPRLTDFYSQFGRGSSHMYWLYDINTALNSKLPQAMATVHFDDEGSIIAQAPIFPVLVQELIKGVIMLISHHQFEGMSASKTKRILAAADTLHDEFPQIMVGPKVWRAFILALPGEYRGRLLEVVMTLARSHPKELDIIMDRLGECIAQRQDPRTSSASSALRDLLERSLTEETPEDVAAMLPDEESEDDYGAEEDDTYGTEEDDTYGTDEDDLNENRRYSFRTINEATTGQNLALGAGLLGGLMGFGGGEAQAQSTQSSQPRLTASEKGSLKKYSRSDLQQKMADAGKYNIAANKVGVQASHVMYQIVNITGGDFQDDIRKKYGQKGAFIAKTMDLLEGVYKDKSGESHEELFDKLLQMYEIDKDSNAYDAVGRVNYKEALRLISKQACLIASKITSTKNESRIGNIGRNLAFAAGTIGGMMGLGGDTRAETPTSPSQIPHLMNKDMASAKARMSSKKPQMTAKQLEAMMDQLDADQQEREEKMSHHEKLLLRIQRAREARGEKPTAPDYNRLMGAIGDEGPSGSANRSGESATERAMRMARRFADPKPAPEYKIGEGPAARNPDGTVNQEVTDIFKEIGPQMGRIDQEYKARMQERYKQAERFLPK